MILGPGPLSVRFVPTFLFLFRHSEISAPLTFCRYLECFLLRSQSSGLDRGEPHGLLSGDVASSDSECLSNASAFLSSALHSLALPPVAEDYTCRKLFISRRCELRQGLIDLEFRNSDSTAICTRRLLFDLSATGGPDTSILMGGLPYHPNSIRR